MSHTSSASQLRRTSAVSALNTRFPISHAQNLRSALTVVLEELVEPLHGLQESGLFRELHVGLAGIGTNGEAVLDAGVQDHLVRNGAHLLEELLGLVALLFGEDLVGFWEMMSILGLEKGF